MANQKKAEYPKEPMKTQETTSKQPKARGDHVVIGFSFASDWLREWRGFSGPITEGRKAKPKQSQIYFQHSIRNCSCYNSQRKFVSLLDKGKFLPNWTFGFLNPHKRGFEIWPWISKE